MHVAYCDLFGLVGISCGLTYLFISYRPVMLFIGLGYLGFCVCRFTLWEAMRNGYFAPVDFTFMIAAILVLFIGSSFILRPCWFVAVSVTLLWALNFMFLVNCLVDV